VENLQIGVSGNKKKTDSSLTFH